MIGIESAQLTGYGSLQSAEVRRPRVCYSGLAATCYGFDTAVDGSFALVTSKLFFPTAGDLNAVLLNVAAFGAGMATWTFGHLVVGSFTDCWGGKTFARLGTNDPHQTPCMSQTQRLRGTAG